LAYVATRADIIAVPLDADAADHYWRVGLPSDELRLYFTPTRRAEAPRVAPAEVAGAILEPEVVHIPAGKFLMGSSDDDEQANDNEKPQHKVELPAYRIGKYPVMNTEYQVFVKETGHRSPRGWDDDRYPEEQGDHPVVNVSWEDARAYCGWLSEKTGKT
jgi:formylglycine-generating enzyme required for sulfatase activity